MAAGAVAFSCLAPLHAAEAPAAASPTPGKKMEFQLPAVVAVVDGEEIKREDLEKALETVLKATGRDPAELTAEQKMGGYRMLLDEMITDRVISIKAKDVKVTKAEVDAQFDKIKSQFESEEALKKQIAEAGETVERVQEQIRNSLKQQKWIEEQIGDKAKVTTEDAKKFYKENPDQFEVQETVRASHILITVPPDASPEVASEKKKEIEKVAKRLKDGEDFAAVAKEVSEDPGSKVNGGDLNFFSKEQMVPEFAEAAFSLEKGKISEPIKTQYGYHLIKVTDKKWDFP